MDTILKESFIVQLCNWTNGIPQKSSD